MNKQLADKERVAAALENPNLVAMVDRCAYEKLDCAHKICGPSIELCVLISVKCVMREALRQPQRKDHCLPYSLTQVPGQL